MSDLEAALRIAGSRVHSWREKRAPDEDDYREVAICEAATLVAHSMAAYRRIWTMFDEKRELDGTGDSADASAETASYLYRIYETARDQLVLLMADDLNDRDGDGGYTFRRLLSRHFRKPKRTQQTKGDNAT